MVTANVLKEFNFFKDFTNEQLERLSSITAEETYAAGSQMYKKGDPARSLYILLEGKVVMSLESYLGPHRPPMQVTVDTIARGETMGWSAVVEPYIYTLGALCIDNSRLIALNAAKLRDLMDEDCDLGYKVMKAIAKIISSRLSHTRIILVGERGLSHLTEY
ncbi:MAG: cyclic nucleotide-binding domain-containing protein [Syntrophales bacterium]|jgi:CRP-like cAMP-binding protein|nr:cyclic nucleotide-binding domain-containing protein [Syntrophales bacterium]MCK9391979.1 cyclic nucleotide-binding domain-containing protein [Syntrophales bacterium]